jgi:hypothetical protein
MDTDQATLWFNPADAGTAMEPTGRDDGDHATLNWGVLLIR